LNDESIILKKNTGRSKSRLAPTKALKICYLNLGLTLCTHKPYNMLRTCLTITLVAGLLSGCANSTSENEEETTPAAPTPVVQENEVTIPDAIQLETTIPTANEAQTNGSEPTVALNPPHGQPGHNCDIAVGAPLDGSASKPQTTAAPAAAQPLVQPNFSGAASTTGLNPPHGQPGHDCDVAVGAPLPAK
jgi:hypothetical protein